MRASAVSEATVAPAEPIAIPTSASASAGASLTRLAILGLWLTDERFAPRRGGP
jgi:hypothetical protein